MKEFDEIWAKAEAPKQLRLNYASFRIFGYEATEIFIDVSENLFMVIT